MAKRSKRKKGATGSTVVTIYSPIVVERVGVIKEITDSYISISFKPFRMRSGNLSIQTVPRDERFISYKGKVDEEGAVTFIDPRASVITYEGSIEEGPNGLIKVIPDEGEPVFVNPAHVNIEGPDPESTVGKGARAARKSKKDRGNKKEKEEEGKEKKKKRRQSKSW